MEEPIENHPHHDQIAARYGTADADSPHTPERYLELSEKPLTLDVLIQQLQQVQDCLKSTNPKATILVTFSARLAAANDGAVSCASFALSNPESNQVDIHFKPLIKKS